MTQTAHDSENSKDQWWRDWFNSIYLDVYSHRDEEQAMREVAATAALLSLRSDHQILDLCCGNGRHCRALHRAGFENVVGVDYSYPLLRHGRTLSPIDFVRGDMRLLPILSDSLDSVLSYFTSFGYFQTNIENLQVLHEAARILKPGGSFLLDYLNPNHVRKHYVPQSVRKHGEYTIHERRYFADDGMRIEKEILIENWGEKEHRFYESVRLYELHEMQDMLESADLIIKNVLGDFSGEAYSKESHRMILYGTKI